MGRLAPGIWPGLSGGVGRGGGVVFRTGFPWSIAVIFSCDGRVVGGVTVVVFLIWKVQMYIHM